MYGWNASTIFYGPYDCGKCGKKIIRKAIMEGHEAFDYPQGMIFPNTEWQLHVCKGETDVANLRERDKDPRKDGFPAPSLGGLSDSYNKPPSPGAGGGQSLEDELWREYEFDTPVSNYGDTSRITYRIYDPKRLWVGTTTHRVLDVRGVVHCVPNVGHRGCVLRWQVKDGAPHVAF